MLAAGKPPGMVVHAERDEGAPRMKSDEPSNALSVLMMTAIIVLCAMPRSEADNPCAGMSAGKPARQGECIDLLIKELGDPSIAPAAVEDLVEIGPPVLTKILVATRSTSESTRANAGDVLGRIGPHLAGPEAGRTGGVAQPSEKEQAVCRLVKLLGDTSPAVRLIAIVGLGRIRADYCNARQVLNTLRGSGDKVQAVMIESALRAIPESPNATRP